MAQGKTNLIDGFSSVQALRHAQKKHGGGRVKVTREADTPAEKPPPSNVATHLSRVSHTAMPSRRAIICYECGYSHTVTGRLHNPFCPKCRKKLETDDRIIEGKWDSDVKTVGNVDIRSGSILEGVTVYGDRIVIAGDVRKAEIKATSQIDLLSGAMLDVTRLKTVTLRIPGKNRVTLAHPLHCKDLEIEGSLKAQVISGGTVRITAGGSLKGGLSCGLLIVEDGGGLIADVELRPNQAKGDNYGN